MDRTLLQDFAFLPGNKLGKPTRDISKFEVVLGGHEHTHFGVVDPFPAKAVSDDLEETLKIIAGRTGLTNDEPLLEFVLEVGWLVQQYTVELHKCEKAVKYVHGSSEMYPDKYGKWHWKAIKAKAQESDPKGKGKETHAEIEAHSTVTSVDGKPYIGASENCKFSKDTFEGAG